MKSCLDYSWNCRQMSCRGLPLPTGPILTIHHLATLHGRTLHSRPPCSLNKRLGSRGSMCLTLQLVLHIWSPHSIWQPVQQGQSDLSSLCHHQRSLKPVSRALLVLGTRVALLPHPGSPALLSHILPLSRYLLENRGTRDRAGITF